MVPANLEGNGRMATGNHDIATLALDAATEADGAARGVPADLAACGRLADALEAAWADADPGLVMDLFAAMEAAPDSLRTMDDLAAAIAAETQMFRRAADVVADAFRPALARGIALHRTFLAIDAGRGFRFGLAA
jgi:hypothetical protein